MRQQTKKLDKIIDWFLANKLSLNVAKTKNILFHKVTDGDNIPLEPSSVQLNGNIIKKKSLDDILDDHLTWKMQMQIIQNKVW